MVVTSLLSHSRYPLSSVNQIRIIVDYSNNTLSSIVSCTNDKEAWNVSSG